MTETSVWVATVVPVIAVLLTALISNSYNSRTQENQHKHEERMKNLELLNAQHLRLNEDKRAAYAAVLSEVGQAHQKYAEQMEAGRLAEKTSMQLYSNDLSAATSRAKLLLDTSQWDAYEGMLSAFLRSCFEKTGETQKSLATLFANDLSRHGALRT